MYCPNVSGALNESAQLPHPAAPLQAEQPKVPVCNLRERSASDLIGSGSRCYCRTAAIQRYLNSA
jgi:hypothetical protein